MISAIIAASCAGVAAIIGAVAAARRKKRAQEAKLKQDAERDK